MSLRIVQITDPHLLAPGELLMGLDVNARLAAALRLARTLDPHAYLLTGDFCAHEPVAEVYARLRPQLMALDRPFYLLPGNHDDRAMLRAVFAELPGSGREAIYQSVNIAGYPFILLDSSTGVVDAAQLEWLADVLPQQPEATIVIHHPPIPLGIEFMDQRYPLRDTERLLELLTQDGHRRRVLCGHYHASRVVCHDNLDVFLCPPTSFFIPPATTEFALDPQPPGFQLLEWTDEGDFRRTHVATS